MSKTKQQVKDQPGTVRISDDGDYAFLTADTDDAPWLVAEHGGRRYWAVDEDVRDWAVRDSY